MSTAASWLLRIGVALAFLYPPIDALTSPDSWVGYFPPFLLTLGLQSEVLLHGFGLLEVVVALWLLWGYRAYIPAVLAAGMLVAIVVFNASQIEILFRDLSIALAALAVAADAWAKRKNVPSPASSQ
jgi:uncharacterized membrane protein YphA (DoxX/SURF4 family)